MTTNILADSVNEVMRAHTKLPTVWTLPPPPDQKEQFFADLDWFGLADVNVSKNSESVFTPTEAAAHFAELTGPLPVTFTCGRDILRGNMQN